MLGKHYQSLSAQMRSHIDESRSRVSHNAEFGKNAERVLINLLRDFLPTKYSVNSGFVVDCFGGESTQTDVIIHDRSNAPALILQDNVQMVPIESTIAVISVKYKIDRQTLRDAAEQIQSVRRLKNSNAFSVIHGGREVDTMLRPRGLIFGFESGWKNPKKIESSFMEEMECIDDRYRSNSICILDHAFVQRIPHKNIGNTYYDNVLLRFFIFALFIIDKFIESNSGRMCVPLERYIEYYKSAED